MFHLRDGSPLFDTETYFYRRESFLERHYDSKTLTVMAEVFKGVILYHQV